MLSQTTSTIHTEYVMLEQPAILLSVSLIHAMSVAVTCASGKCYICYRQKGWRNENQSRFHFRFISISIFHVQPHKWTIK